jgi:hypothetical protein
MLYLTALKKSETKKRKKPETKKKYSAFAKKPPTLGAFYQHLLRCHVQARICHQADQAFVDHVDPVGSGWHVVDGKLYPVTTTDTIVPSEILNLDSCGCKGNCETRRCSCRRREKNCGQFCMCGDNCENCDTPPSQLLGKFQSR